MGIHSDIKTVMFIPEKDENGDGIDDDIQLAVLTISFMNDDGITLYD
jgi:hypothetical protein